MPKSKKPRKQKPQRSYEKKQRPKTLSSLRLAGAPRSLRDIVLVATVTAVRVDEEARAVLATLDLPLRLQGQMADRCYAVAELDDQAVANVLRGVPPGERVLLCGALLTENSLQKPAEMPSTPLCATLNVHAVLAGPLKEAWPNGPYAIFLGHDGKLVGVQPLDTLDVCISPAAAGWRFRPTPGPVPTHAAPQTLQ